MAHASLDLNLQDLWAIDTGCTRHLTRSRANFVEYTALPSSAKTINGVGGTSCQPTGYGTVKLECSENNNRVVLLLSNVFHVPDSRVNLISVSQLIDLDAEIDFTKSHCFIKHGKHQLTGSGRNGLWFLNLL